LPDAPQGAQPASSALPGSLPAAAGMSGRQRLEPQVWQEVLGRLGRLER